MKLRKAKEYVIMRNWKRETKALEVLDDPYIVREIGAFTQHGKYFILTEWADGGDLINMRTSNPNPHLELTATRVAQFLEQFRGLASALNRMHLYKAEEDPDLVVSKQAENQEVETKNLVETKSLHEADQSSDVNFKVPEIEVDMYESPRTAGSWSHGNLRPNNILCFRGEDSSRWIGTLKLTSLGKPEKHMHEAALRPERRDSDENFTILKYDPPEVWTSLSMGRSRPMDIWSFGCILLESIIWLLFGFEELCNFGNREPSPYGSLYWTVESFYRKTCKLNEATFEWIHHLLGEDPECQAREKGSALRDVILLITRKLLVIRPPKNFDVYEEGCRINSEILVKELDEIIQKGTHDTSYMFSGYSRAGIVMPRIT
jgi:serine/threonine protein kinase